MEQERDRIAKHLANVLQKPVDVDRVELLSGGACQENYRVDVTIAGEKSTFALRSDAKTALPGSIDRASEFAVIGLARSAGVKTPRAQWLVKGLVRDDGHAYFSDWVSGEAIGRKVVGSKELASARAVLPAQVGTELAKIHSVKPGASNASAGIGASIASGDVNGSARAVDASFDPARVLLANMRGSIDKIHAPRPALELIHRWLSENAPKNDASDVVLVHGDYRTGNFMVDQNGLVAILDWEFSHWGSRYMDLSWICLRDWRFGQLDLPVGGFGKREAFYDAYEKESRIKLDPKKLFYWEILGNLSWAIGSVYQSERYVYGGEDEFELVAIGRRAAEMEFEAMRLIEKGRL